MDQLFDSLSEDWISQPRSNESVPDSPSPSFARSTASHQSRASQSRIPRVANSTPLTPSAGASRRSQSVLSGKSLAKRNEPLKEVTASHINASINKKPPEQRSPAKQQEKVGAKPAQKALTSKIPQGTVQRNLESVTASKSNRPLGTPDWKRRLRKDIASGQAQDLFSANGLEGIFKPPVGSPTGSISKKKVSVPTNDFRSSPPPYPPPVTNRKVQSDNVQKPSTSLIRKPSQDCGHRRPSSAAGPHHERSRQTSGGTDELNENISPYYVSRHNTVDGHVDYAPIDLSMSQIRAQINRVRQQQQHLVSSVATESASDGRETRQEPMTETPNSDWQNQSLPDDLSTGTAAFTLNGGFVTMRRGGASNESSFMRRSLSPSSERRVSRTGLRRSLSVGATPKDPTNAAEIPSTPQGFTRIGSYQLNAEGKPSSPLKLFDHHDTFTNNRLLRHLGTFDDESVRGAHTQLVQASKRRGTDVDQHRIRHSCDQSFGGTQLHGHDFDCSALSSELSSVRLPTRNRQDLSSFPRESRSGEVSVSSTTFSAGKAVEFTTQGKRLPYSPHKVPRRKRRRTLLQESSGRPPLTSESSIGVSGSASRLPPQSVVGKKRKDALHGKRSEAADPDVLALRQILRPRTLTQSKSLPQDENRHPRSSTPSMSVNDIKIRDGPAKPLLAGELTNIAVDMVKHIVAADNSRKPSVTTADFHREAQQVMQLLRMQGRPLGGLPEQDSERDQACERSSPVYDRESTRDDFSRPPSREGSKPRGRSDHALINQRVVSQLQRFQEDDEPGLVLSSSLKSLKLTTGTSEERAKVVETRPSNPSDFTEDEAHNVNSIDSKASSDPSTQRSIPTNSSQSSKGKAVIPPDAVAHLLSAEVAGMTFDHANQRWVRSRSPERSRKSGLSPQPDSILTEEDVFARISDLSTEANDGHQPLGHSQGSGRESNKDLRNAISRHDCANDYCPRPGLSTRPHTADGARSETLEASSAPSRFSQWASSGPPPETRATSWGDEAFTGKIGHPISDHQAADQTPDAESEEEVEHEISILDGRESKKAIESKRVGHQQPRVVTVSFSSPLETHHEEIDAGDESATNMSRYPHPCRMASVGNRRRRASFTKRRSSSHGKAYIRSAQDYNDLFPRPMSRLDEREEDSVNGHNSQIYNGDMQVAISTPLAQHRITPSQLTLGGPVSSIGFQLTPLSAFTTHPHDSSLDVEGDYLARRVGKDVARKGSLATQELVKKLQDAQPDEPYWDYLPDLVLQDQKLSTLHMLDEFCCSLVRLDVSNNALSEVNGAPPSVRYLNATNNMISDLAPWAHLRNLQYLDVSGNQLTTLQGFRALVHLRELKADNNRIESLDGIEMLDGLIYFSLCNNLVGKVDFDGFELHRLQALDLDRNRLISIKDLDQITALEHLSLDGNSLKRFDSYESSSDRQSGIKHLSIQGNGLTYLDVGKLSSLESLRVDGNALCEIKGLDALPRLGTLSWREQSTSAKQDAGALVRHCDELSSLWLSGTFLQHLTPSSMFLNLCHLELASAGLEALDEGLGVHMPNLRSLNLNFNAIRDLRPLAGIHKLQKLWLAGNRISRLRQTTHTLREIGKNLTELDLRNNILTVGFYTLADSNPIAERGLVRTSRSRAGHEHRPATLAQERTEDMEHSKYFLAHVSGGTDGTACQRLDEDTALRRRVYEWMMIHSCPKVEILDGMDVAKRGLAQEDQTWRRLIELGVLTDKGAACHSG